MPSDLLGADHRRFYRLRYPDDRCARIVIHAQNYQVMEISEEGLRIACDHACFAPGKSLMGTIIAHAGYLGEVEGVVLRYDESEREFVMRLNSKRIPQHIIFEEQRFLLQHPAQRRHIHLEYPANRYAQLRIRSQRYQVHQISENEVYFRPAQTHFSPGERVTGTVTLLANYQGIIEGHIQCCDPEHNAAVLHLVARGIPVEVVFDEQQYLIRHCEAKR